LNDILSRFKAERLRIDTEAAEAERKRQQEAEELRQEQEKLRIQREEMLKEQERLQMQREALEKQQQELARQEKLRQQEQERKERWAKAEAERLENERVEKLWRGRLAELLDVVFDGEAAIYNDHEFITVEELISFSDEDFNKVRDIHNKQVADNRADAERNVWKKKKSNALKQIEKRL
jgi:hypothetical protein